VTYLTDADPDDHRLTLSQSQPELPIPDKLTLDWTKPTWLQHPNGSSTGIAAAGLAEMEKAW
jgi:hypothetical protein